MASGGPQRTGGPRPSLLQSTKSIASTGGPRPSLLQSTKSIASTEGPRPSLLQSTKSIASTPQAARAQDLTLSLLEHITNNFSDEVRVGSGGFGEVYWGIYRDEKIAVKKLYDQNPRFNDAAFKKEFNNSLKLHHPNTVRLVGYCYETREINMQIKPGEYEFVKRIVRILCFEYCQGGSLDKYIDEKFTLFSERDLDTRLKIIRGISEGLNYLHNGQAQYMYHLDLKPENILLDEKNMPKIADFGISRFLAITKTHITKSPCTGTMGYMPPEYINGGKISSKFDVFSLGVIILQVLAVPLGYSKYNIDDMSPREFVEQVRRNWDERPPMITSSELYRVKEYIDIALRCVEKEREKRPKIRDIVCQLQDIDAQHSVGPSRAPTIQMKDLALDPAFELRFPFERSKQIPCCLQLTNNTDGFIAFNIKMDQTKYHAHPNKSTVRPRSYCNIVITSREWNTEPPSTPRDSILVQSTRVGSDLSPAEIADNMFDTSTGNAVDQVELPVVYVPILQHPFFLRKSILQHVTF